MSKQSKYWDEIIEQYKTSGLTQRAFCKANGLTNNQFKYRWYTLKAKARATACIKTSTKHSFEPIQIATPTLISSPISKSMELSIQLPNKVRCDIKMDLCTDTLPALLKQLVNIC